MHKLEVVTINVNSLCQVAKDIKCRKIQWSLFVNFHSYYSNGKP